MEYPRIVYKSRGDYKKVNNIDEQEKLAEDGYGDFEIVVLGKMPEGIKEVKPEETKPKRRPARRRKVTT